VADATCLRKKMERKLIMKKRIEKKYILMALLALMVILLSILFNNLLEESAKYKGFSKTIKGTFMPIIWGFIIAYLLNPIMKRLEQYVFMPLAKKLYQKQDKEKKQKKFARAGSVILTMALFLFVLIGGLCVVIPQIYESVAKIIRDVPEYYAEVETWVTEFMAEDNNLSVYILDGLDNLYIQLMDYVNTVILPNADKIVKGITTGIIGVIKVLLNIVLAIIISIYVLCEKESFIAYAKKLTYTYLSKKRAHNLIAGTRHVNRVFGGFINGKIVDSFIIGALCYIFMVIANFEYAVLISIIIGVTNIIPYFGPFIGAIPSVFLLLVTEPKQGLIFAVFILILQQLDGNVIGPLILGESLNLSSMWILLAILIGGGLFGVPGMILGAPTMACIYTILRKDTRVRLAAKNMPTESKDYLHLDIDAANAEDSPEAENATSEGGSDAEAPEDSASGEEMNK